MRSPPFKKCTHILTNKKLSNQTVKIKISSHSSHHHHQDNTTSVTTRIAAIPVTITRTTPAHLALQFKAVIKMQWNAELINLANTNNQNTIQTTTTTSNPLSTNPCPNSHSSTTQHITATAKAKATPIPIPIAPTSTIKHDLSINGIF